MQPILPGLVGWYVEHVLPELEWDLDFSVRSGGDVGEAYQRYGEMLEMLGFCDESEWEWW